jgi:hypothetical protein
MGDGLKINDIHDAKSIEEIFRDKGITRCYLAQKLKAELNAKTVKVFSNNGEVIYSENLVDWHTRQVARMDAQKLLGLYPAEKSEVTGEVKLSLATLLKEIDGKGRGLPSEDD